MKANEIFRELLRDALRNSESGGIKDQTVDKRVLFIEAAMLRHGFSVRIAKDCKRHAEVSFGPEGSGDDSVRVN